MPSCQRCQNCRTCHWEHGLRKQPPPGLTTTCEDPSPNQHMCTFCSGGRPLTIVSLNVDGIRGNAAYIADPLNRFPKVFLQEHWLYRFEADKLLNLFSNITGTIKCVYDRDPLPLRLRPKGSASVATLWDKSCECTITTLPDDSDRVLVVHINATPVSLVLVNTYKKRPQQMTVSSSPSVRSRIYMPIP